MPAFLVTYIFDSEHNVAASLEADSQEDAEAQVQAQLTRATFAVTTHSGYLRYVIASENVRCCMIQPAASGGPPLPRRGSGQGPTEQ